MYANLFLLNILEIHITTVLLSLLPDKCKKKKTFCFILGDVLNIANLPFQLLRYSRVAVVFPGCVRGVLD